MLNHLSETSATGFLGGVSSDVNGALLGLLRLAALLFPSPLLLLKGIVPLLGILVAVETDPVPGELEQAVHALQRASRSLGDEEPDPDTADKRDGGKAPEGTLGRDAAVLDREEHVGHGAGVAVLEQYKLA